MLNKLRTAIGFKSNTARMNHGPYSDASANLIYNALFCDQLQLYKENYHGELVEPWSILFSDFPDPDSLIKLAESPDTESRVRALAFNLLRANGHEVPEKVLLGTIIEVRLPEGLDTIAVFTDGTARYINHTGKIAVVERTANTFKAEISAVIEASNAIVAEIGPWGKDRLNAPENGNIRMSFLVSDGLYFGEGPMDQMEIKKISSPLINAAVSLLQKLVGKRLSNPFSLGIAA
jgi:hypothetical protein